MGFRNDYTKVFGCQFEEENSKKECGRSPFKVVCVDDDGKGNREYFRLCSEHIGYFDDGK